MDSAAASRSSKSPDPRLSLLIVSIYAEVDNATCLAAESTQELRLCKDMPLARLQHMSLGRTRFQIKDHI
jgi:hypothetical protein